MEAFMPPAKSPLDLSSLRARTDVSRVFLTFIQSGGNRFRTAAATGLSVDEVENLAKADDWYGKLAERGKIAEGDSKTGEEINREIARLQAAAQSQRLIDEINIILMHLEKLDKDSKMEYLFEVDRTGKKTPTAKFYLDLAKGLEVAHGCLYRANADQLPGRPDAEDSPLIAGKNLATGMALAVAEMMKPKGKPVVELK